MSTPEYNERLQESFAKNRVLVIGQALHCLVLILLAVLAAPHWSALAFFVMFAPQAYPLVQHFTRRSS